MARFTRSTNKFIQICEQEDVTKLQFENNERNIYKKESICSNMKIRKTNGWYDDTLALNQEFISNILIDSKMSIVFDASLVEKPGQTVIAKNRLGVELSAKIVSG